MSIPIIPCPLCHRKGSVPYRATTTKAICTTRCPLCWGLGNIPVLEVVSEGCRPLAVHYWLCNCPERDQRIHPSNQDVCLICDQTEGRAGLAPAEDVQVFFQNSYGLRLGIVEIT